MNLQPFLEEGGRILRESDTVKEARLRIEEEAAKIFTQPFTVEIDWDPEGEIYRSAKVLASDRTQLASLTAAS